MPNQKLIDQILEKDNTYKSLLNDDILGEDYRFETLMPTSRHKEG